ncbi:MAG TPA: carboxylesterase family protein [Actinophytocola sp.]|uniref:carboxylesterase/lipase family protein n=1 Tax=Actinophytocola sp. TaxID=1872138 RepID=UPI002DB88371|nr:carboxylesterase family protein [Actinophytocola sp.]HEU5475589.1 carboxylesterase family protein [Actinophytocola sp.]
MSWRRSMLAAAGAIGLLLTGAAVPATGAPTGSRNVVQTDRGPVRGVLGENYRAFNGIPYAAAPVGELRWRSPQPAPRWREPLDASVPGPDCAQTPFFSRPASDHEDCLFLNVVTPRRASGRLPVLVWFHGGGYTNGSGAEQDGRTLAAAGDVIVVTVNYRLGALGFLALPALDGERRGAESGNFGIEDQQAALRWVRRNAAAFGGDPGNVTIFGSSAGSGSVCMNLISPAAAGLFHKAILQSFTCGWPMTPRPDAEAAGATFAAGIGCADPATVLRCLRDKPVGDLVAAWPGGFPVIGGRLLPMQPPDALRADRFHHVPMMLGNAKDEMRLFVSLQHDGAGRPVDAATFEQIVRSSYGADAEQVLTRYPLSAYPTPGIALATVQTDAPGLLSTCSHLGSYRTFAARPFPVPVHAYQFADRTAPPLVDVPGFDEGAEHSVELNFLFPGHHELSAPQQALAGTMIGYWANFAHRGNPNGPGLPDWPRFRTAADVLTLDLGPGGVRPVDIGAASNCAMWESMGG